MHSFEHKTFPSTSMQLTFNMINILNYLDRASGPIFYFFKIWSIMFTVVPANIKIQNYRIDVRLSFRLSV